MKKLKLKINNLNLKNLKKFFNFLIKMDLMIINIL